MVAGNVLMVAGHELLVAGNLPLVLVYRASLLSVASVPLPRVRLDTSPLASPSPRKILLIYHSGA